MKRILEICNTVVIPVMLLLLLLLAVAFGTCLLVGEKLAISYLSFNVIVAIWIFYEIDKTPLVND